MQHLRCRAPPPAFKHDRVAPVTSSLRHGEGDHCPLRPASSHLASRGARLVTCSNCKCAAVARQNRAEQSRCALNSSHELTNVSPSLPPSCLQGKHTAESSVQMPDECPTHTLTGEITVKAGYKQTMPFRIFLKEDFYSICDTFNHRKPP